MELVGVRVPVGVLVSQWWLSQNPSCPPPRRDVVGPVGLDGFVPPAARITNAILLLINNVCYCYVMSQGGSSSGARQTRVSGKLLSAVWKPNPRTLKIVQGRSGFPKQVGVPESSRS